MSEFVEFFLAAIDVIRTELKAAREPLFYFVAGLILLAFGIFTMLGGVGLLATGVLLGLAQSVPLFAAAIITGALLLALGGGVYWFAKLKAKAP